MLELNWLSTRGISFFFALIVLRHGRACATTPEHQRLRWQLISSGNDDGPFICCLYALFPQVTPLCCAIPRAALHLL